MDKLYISRCFSTKWPVLMDKLGKNSRFSIEWCLFMDKVIKKPKRLPLLLGVFLAVGALTVGLAGVFEDHEGDEAGKDYADKDVCPCRGVVALDARPHLQKWTLAVCVAVFALLTLLSGSMS